MSVSVSIPMDLSIHRILCRQGLAGPGKPAPQVLALSQKLLSEGAWRDLLQPAVACQSYRVVNQWQEGLELENGDVLECRLPGYHAAELAFAAGTIGPKLEQEVDRLFASREGLTAVLLDGLGNAALDCAVREAARLAGLHAAGRSYQVSKPVMPGCSMLPLSQQGKVFELAGARDIGMKLIPPGVMAPLKSLSMVMALGPDVPAWSACQGLCHGCEMAERCSYRDLNGYSGIR